MRGLLKDEYTALLLFDGTRHDLDAEVNKDMGLALDSLFTLGCVDRGRTVHSTTPIRGGYIETYTYHYSITCMGLLARKLVNMGADVPV